MNLPVLNVATAVLLGASAWAQAAKPLLNQRELPLVAAPSFSEPLAEPFSASKGQWTPKNGVLNVTDIQDEMAARLDGKELRAQHAYLATAKVRSWLAANQSVKVRNLTIRGEEKKP